MHTLNRLLAPIKRRVQFIATRAVVHLVDPAMLLQELQVEGLAGEVLDGIEHVEPYGCTANPHAGAEAILLSLGGRRGHTVCIVAADRRYRLKGLAKGEVALYDDIGHQVHLTRTGIVIRGAGHPVVITDTPTLRVEADIEATGQIKDLCDSGGKTMSSMRQVFNGHRHAGGATPDQEM